MYENPAALDRGIGMSTSQFDIVSGLLSMVVFLLSIIAVVRPTRNRILNMSAMFVSGYLAYAYLGGKIFNFWHFDANMVRVAGLLAILLIGIHVARDLALSSFRRDKE
jgi:small neutral amino acid transporter SnatA (MarC family)